MKKQLILSYCVLFFVTTLLVNCKDDPNTTPVPGSDNTPAPTITSVTPATGSVGTKVVIVGMNFSTTASENKIKFGTIEVIADSATATRLVTKIPKDAVTGKISVQVKSKSATFTTDFTVVQETPAFVNSGNGATNSTNVTATSASVTSTIGKEGSKTIIQHGHVWSSTSKEPVVNGRISATEGKTELGTLPAGATFPYEFKSDVKDLDANTTYNVRAYVTTSEGTTYGAVSVVESKGPCLLIGYNQHLNPAGPSITFVYDQKGRVIKAGANLSFEYETDGNLSIAEYGTTIKVKETFSYTDARLSKISMLQSDGFGRTTTFEYDAVGKISKRVSTTSNNGVVEDIFKDGTWLSSTSKANGNLIGERIITNGRLVEIKTSGLRWVYEYDSDGNRTLENFYGSNGDLIEKKVYKFDGRQNFLLYPLQFKGWQTEHFNSSNIANLVGIRPYQYQNWTDSKDIRVINGKEEGNTITRTYSYDGINKNVSQWVESLNAGSNKVFLTTVEGDCK